MKMSELKMKCGDCLLIDYCNAYEDTPPCCQPRFENMEVQDFLNIVDYLKDRSLWEDE